MPASGKSTTRTVVSGGSMSTPSVAQQRQQQPGNYVQRGHEITTVRKTETTTTRNRRGRPVVKTKTHTVYYVDGKPVKLNWFDRLRIRFMSTYEKQAFLAEKLLKQEKKERSGRG